MPFEGVPHAATWLCWPFKEANWSAPLESVRVEFAQFVECLAEVEQVELLVATEEAASDVRNRLQPRFRERVRLHYAEIDDVWFRDCGPIFLTRGTPEALEVSATVWNFNAWGNKFQYGLDCQVARTVCRELGIEPFEGPLTLEGGAIEVDGAGTGMTTLPCLLGTTRNPGLVCQDVEVSLCQYFGVDRWIWLDYGLEGDHTDGHIDTLARFVRPGVVVAATCARDDANYQGLQRNRRALRNAGQQVIDLPIPSRARFVSGLRLPETYANYYVANEVVIVPQYGDRHDARALAILRECFPRRQVVGLMSKAIITGGGSFHCLSQQQPQGILCSSR